MARWPHSWSICMHSRKRMFTCLIRSALALWLVLAGGSSATWAQEPGAEAQTPEQKAFLEKLRALAWVKGPTSVTADGNAKLTIPDQYVYLDARNTSKFLELQHNLGNGHEVMVA